MKLSVKVPKLGLTTEQVIVSEWVKTPGSDVTKGEIIVILEADKATVEVDAPMSGRLIQQLADVGTELSIGEPLALLEVSSDE
ncbi:biotin attachment protein [Alcaligenaceae bacterium]|nr:biotin attachment protein [Alcaligenaceae bacterium]